MPVIWDAARYNAAYRIKVRDPAAADFGQWVGYGKRFAQRAGGPYDDEPKLYDDLAARLGGWLSGSFGLTSTARVLIAGCGFGYLVNGLHRAGWPNVWGIDFPGYLDTLVDGEKLGTPGIVFDDIRQSTAVRVRNAIRKETGGTTFDAVVTEAYFTMSFDDTEIADLFAGTEALMGDNPHNHILHLVMDYNTTPPGEWPTAGGDGDAPPAYNPIPAGLEDLHWHSLDVWTTHKPEHSWGDLYEGRLYIGSG